MTTNENLATTLANCASALRKSRRETELAKLVIDAHVYHIAQLEALIATLEGAKPARKDVAL